MYLENKLIRNMPSAWPPTMLNMSCQIITEPERPDNIQYGLAWRETVYIPKKEYKVALKLQIMGHLESFLLFLKVCRGNRGHHMLAATV